jgi:hypothetical protein
MKVMHLFLLYKNRQTNSIFTINRPILYIYIYIYHKYECTNVHCSKPPKESGVGLGYKNTVFIQQK